MRHTGTSLNNEAIKRYNGGQRVESRSYNYATKQYETWREAEVAVVEPDFDVEEQLKQSGLEQEEEIS